MARLLDDLLDVSRVTQRKIEIRSEVVDLTSLVDDAVAAVHPVVESRRHHVKVDLPEEPLRVEGDPARLLQVIENLLMNAAKYTQPAGHIELLLRRNGDAAEICVRDDGIGIPANMLDQIFDLFVQSEGTADGSGGGMGVGLTLVKHLVELQGGAVTASSPGRNKGSTFTVRVPLTERMPAKADEVEPPLFNAVGTKIVLVEDNADAREMLKSLLELDGYQVVTAEDGRLGVEAIFAEHPNVAIVDIGLPELDGFAVARQVRASTTDHSVYLVALTGYGQQQDRVAVLEAGFDEHLIKPVDPKELGRVLGSRPKPR
jgi:two-component system CheB/CheR fusion protein